jgi:hypothetical protein
MIEDASGPSAVRVVRSAPRPVRPFILWLVGVGVMAGIAAIAIGLRMAFHATVVECENGHYFPEGTTDFRCFAHKHAGDGATIALIALMLAILLVFAGVLAHNAFGASTRSD